jgi:uncharacterized protein (TIGR03437 family)
MNAATSSAAPGIFAIPGPPDASLLYAAAVNQDGTINSQQNPASRGSIVAIFATGLGSLITTPVDGMVTGLPLSMQSLVVEIESPNPSFQATSPLIEATQWAGQAPFEIAGLSQVNVEVPGYGNQISLTIHVQGSSGYVTSPPVLLWVQ